MNTKTASCHPESRYYAKDLCQRCYNRATKVRLRDSINARKREWHHAHREEMAERSRRYYAANADTMRERARKWSAEHPERKRDTRLKKDYGISLAEYEAMFVEQNGACAICHIEHKKLFVDHDHDTGDVRGLLCRHCNIGLGHYRDSARLLLAAVAYLESDR